MAEPILVSKLINIIRDRTDMQDTNYITDTELVRLIDMSNTELYSIITQANSTYFKTQTTITTNSTDAEYDLPSDFWQVQGVDFNYDAQRKGTGVQIQFEQRNKYFGRGTYYYSNAYYLMGSKIGFPNPRTLDITLHYVPTPTEITATTDTINTIQGGWRWIVADVSAMVLDKEESDSSMMLGEKLRLEKRILESLAERDNGIPLKVTDENDLDNWRDGGFGGFW